jgi:hypothetical protein
MATALPGYEHGAATDDSPRSGDQNLHAGNKAFVEIVGSSNMYSRKELLARVTEHIRLPIRAPTWMLQYNRKKATADILATLAVVSMLLPQALAYSLLAGLDPQYGLYRYECALVDGGTYAMLVQQ